MSARNLEDRTTSKMNNKSSVKQSERGAANINTIIANYRSTGVMGHVNAATPLYGDFTAASDLQTQLHRTIDAQARFDALPAAIRKAAENDMVKFLAMTQEDEGLALLTDLGLVMVEDLDQDEIHIPKLPDPPPAETPTPPITGGE